MPGSRAPGPAMAIIKASQYVPVKINFPRHVKPTIRHHQLRDHINSASIALCVIAVNGNIVGTSTIASEDRRTSRWASHRHGLVTSFNEFVLTTRFAIATIKVTST